MYSLLSVIVLILDIAAIVDILQKDASVGWKLLWILLVLILPILGMILYYTIAKNQTAR